MSHRNIRFGCLLSCALGTFSVGAFAQTLSVNNDIHRAATLASTTATLTGYSELHVTGASSPITGSTIHLNSPDSWFFLDNILPSQVASTYLSQVRVNGANAVLDSNVRVVQYGQGAVVIPHAPGFAPLTVYADANFGGASTTLAQYAAHNAASLGSFSNSISSLKLKRGYMATVAVEENGTGVSRNYVAQDGDIEIPILPSGLDNTIKFVRVFPWRWTAKKGIAGDAGPNLKLHWDYNWNISKNSSLDQEYVAIRQTRWWPGLGQDWQARGINTLLGYNEPDSADQSNIAYGDAVWSWPDLLGTGLRVGSPAPTDGGLSWLNSFMTGAAAENKRVDFVAVHYYRCYGNAADPAGAANQFYNFLKGVYDTHRKPIWITEWNNGANWTSCADPTAAQQQATVAAMLTMLDNAYFVERYAIYNWVEDVRRVSWDDGSLTAAGVSYRDKISPLSHRQEVPDAGTTATALYAFEGNAQDGSGNGHHGLQAGARAFTTGQSGQAINLDGVNDYIQVSPRLASGADFTFAAWVYWTGGSNWQRIFDFGDGTDRYLFLSPNASGSQLRFAIKNGGGEQQLNASILPTNTWTHLAVTLSGNTGTLYVNGAAVATNTGMTINPSDLGAKYNYLGKSQFTADPLFAGRLDDVRIQASAMTAAQIAALAAPLPSPWASSDIGAVGAAGSVGHSSGTFNVAGSGENIWGTADEFRYLYVPASGDCTITARVSGISAANTWAKGGVMIRESLAANSRHTLLAATPNGTMQFIRRSATGGSSVTTDTAGLAAPRWVRLARVGNTITASHSTNGTSWTTFGTQSVTMGTNIYIGLAVVARTDGAIATLTADNVTATP
jgi:hypothetical protein